MAGKVKKKKKNKEKTLKIFSQTTNSIALLFFRECSLDRGLTNSIKNDPSTKMDFMGDSLAQLAVGQRAYAMVRCPSCVCPSVNFFFKHLL